jgi:hypothetical protein
MAALTPTRPIWEPPIWPNLQSCGTLVTIGALLACTISKVPQNQMVKINFSIRFFTGTEAIRYEKQYKVAMEVLAFVALFFPYGRVMSVGIDSMSELINFYDRPPLPIPGGDKALVIYEEPTYLVVKIFKIALMKVQQLFPQPRRRPKFVYRSPDRIDPKIFANACIILGVGEDQVNDLALVKRKYLAHVTHFKKIIQKMPEVFVEDTYDSLREVQIAYQTIQAHVSQQKT